jgi:hypothetical protein
MINSSDLKQMSQILEAHKLNDYNRLIRLKKSVPFSYRLNKFLEDFYQSKGDIFIFTELDEFDNLDLPGTFAGHLKRFKDTGKIQIWTGASDTSIFGEARLNWLFRGWHDFTHLTNNLDYSYMNEIIVCEIQKKQIPEAWNLEKNLVHIEIIGQALFYYKNNYFVEDQRRFTLEYLLNPGLALKLYHHD